MEMEGDGRSCRIARNAAGSPVQLPVSLVNFKESKSKESWKTSDPVGPREDPAGSTRIPRDHLHQGQRRFGCHGEF